MSTNKFNIVKLVTLPLSTKVIKSTKIKSPKIPSTSTSTTPLKTTTEAKNVTTTKLIMSTTNEITSTITTTLIISATTIAQPTTLTKFSCENGGIFIDNSCICLNFFTGDRCEIPPGFFVDEQNNAGDTIADTNDSRNTLIIETTKKNDQATKKFKVFTKFNENPEDTMFWPWFECFPGNSTISVQDLNGATYHKFISELKVGDLVLATSEQNTNTAIYSPVLTFLHKIREANAIFSKITYNDSNDNESIITLTPKHLIYVSKTKNEQDFEYKAANEVEVGDYLKYFNKLKNEFEHVRVSKVDLVQFNNSGIYAPLTKSGTIIVNNIKVSCYSMVKSHYLTQKVFSFLNNFKDIFNIDSKFYVKYAKFLFNIINSLNLSSLFLNI
jgi:hypothetical protein